MTAYSWKTTLLDGGSGSWTNPVKWSPSTAYPNSTVDTATIGAYNRQVSLTSDVSLLWMSVAQTSTAINTFSGTNRITFAVNGYIRATANSSFTNPSVISIPWAISSAPSSPLFIGSSDYYLASVIHYATLTNSNNNIYQLGGTPVAGLNLYANVGFDSVAALGIQHPTHVFATNIWGNSNNTVSLFSTGTGGTLDKSLWDIASPPISGTQPAHLTLSSSGTAPFKIGRAAGVTNFARGGFLWLKGTLAPQSESNDNELKDTLNFVTGLALGANIEKYNNCRWIFSGNITGFAAKTTVYGGYLQLSAAVLVTTKLSAATISGTSSCLEISGTGTITTPISIPAGAVGPSNSGAVRSVTGASVTVGASVLSFSSGGSKLAASTGSTLTIGAASFVVNPQNINIVFGGEGTGTIDFQYALAGTSTSVVITKEDSGILKMTTNDKTYLANTNINGGTIWCDGPTRISGSDLVTVANGAKLRSSFVGTTALSVKALTLNAGSFVQVD